MYLSLFSLFLIVFNFLFFLLGDDSVRNASLWISYGFIHFSYVIFVLSIFMTKKSSGENAYGAPTVYITWKYFVIEFFVGLLFIWINFDGIWLALSTQILLAACAITMWMIHLLANEYTGNSLRVQQHEISYIREYSGRLKFLIPLISDVRVAKEVEKCYELLNASPTHTNLQVSAIEKDIANRISQLEEAVEEKNFVEVSEISKQINRCILERNLKLKN